MIEITVEHDDDWATRELRPHVIADVDGHRVDLMGACRCWSTALAFSTLAIAEFDFVTAVECSALAQRYADAFERIAATIRGLQR
jgi:hypothetical protein